MKNRAARHTDVSFSSSLSIIHAKPSRGHLCTSLVSLCSVDTAFPVTAMHEKMKNRAQEKERPRQDVQNICLVFLQEEQGGARHES